ncbi:PLP-dependent aminotransferase family protein [Antarcticirhabdus aurantiaca]|uniref:PLP-dependent aminotransferase family protein n=1 Tax=Antarcticirhabdus aurantiaca TaxID=2606717 RepID=A0ACD4NWP5_9HYPH|nr:PLP-dependent aminotransferase family protein [Antarcticirhabdus aurantiaca]WAJ31208.1 PLP-dependent aminotransferase family protein [Jeongeuplla avenae]
MTSFRPEPIEGDSPYYSRLADAFEAAVADGRLEPGAKLPPQRNLAFDLGVTVGTVGRAYALLRERGLVSGEIGRGTYVLDHARAGANQPTDSFTLAFNGTRHVEAPLGKLRFDTTAAPDVDQGPIIGETLSAIAREMPLEVASYSRTTPASWLQAGARWLSRNDWIPAEEDIVATQGATAAALSVITAMSAPGDRIVFENLTYSFMARSARLAGRRTVGVELDAEGMLPDDFERVCAQQHPKLAFLMPTLHNPTLAILPEERRRQIAEIARRYGVWLIEDDLYGDLSDDPTPLVVQFAPDRTFVVGGLSKSVAAGLRGGWVACPPHLAQRVKVTHKLLTGGLSFILAEAGARLVLSGAADELRARSMAEIAARQAIVAQALAGHDFATHAHAPFIWLKLPEPWLSGTFKAAAARENILVDDEDEYKPERMERSYHRARMSYSSGDRQGIAAGFAQLRRLLDSGVAGYDGEA